MDAVGQSYDMRPVTGPGGDLSLAVEEGKAPLPQAKNEIIKSPPPSGSAMKKRASIELSPTLEPRYSEYNSIAETSETPSPRSSSLLCAMTAMRSPMQPDERGESRCHVALAFIILGFFLAIMLCLVVWYPG